MKSLISLFFLLGSLSLHAADKPNILWITSEDNASHWLGCYGNPQVKTPNLDALAAKGIRFQNAYSNSPVCAVARSTILIGAYAPTMGTQHMRSRYPIEEKFKPYVHYLKEAGYFCTNRSKTDYNIKGNDKAIWDACGSGKAHYKNRKEGQPFFHVHNIFNSHESSLFSRKKKKGQTQIKPEDVIVPPYLPDLPEIRSDLAHYHDIITGMDSEVGKLLDELESKGQTEDTIVFYYADHGGILPRGKRYLKNTGVKIPMIVHFPEKWAHLSPFKAGSNPEEPVAFVDLAPTLLSLIGQDKPEQMQGRAFLGEKRVEPKEDEMVFLYGDRFDEINGMRRGITDGRWKYIHRFTPHLPAAPYSFYQFGQQGWVGYRKAWQEGKLKPEHARMWETPQPIQELFDTKNDPWEIDNLAGKKEHGEQLAKMRKALIAKMIEARDTGIVPESLFEPFAGDQPVSSVLVKRKDLPALVELAFHATSGDPGYLDSFKTAMKSEDMLTRYWAAHACVVLGNDAQQAEKELLELTKDPVAGIRITAAHALHRMGKDQTELLISELSKNSPDMAKLAAINSLRSLGLDNKIPEETLDLLSKSNDNYVSRFAKELKK
ncbi:MAG: sulfatase-like hydrolase/transferase [Akkermansiaceae bacterium]|nr:sulfatase-like hydrolase/transferase [Akkermansiaceae bacterium]